MKIILVLFLLATLIPVAQAEDSSILDSLPTYSIHYDPQRDALQDGIAAVKLASETNRRILVEVGGDWCTWCHRMDRFFDANPSVKLNLHQAFVLLKVNVSEENDNAEFLKVFPDPLGYPHMYVTEPNGQVLWSHDTAGFLVDGQYNRDRFLEFIDHWKIK